MNSGSVDFEAGVRKPRMQASGHYSMPLVVIAGINGRQGTSVANAFLNGGDFRVRGLTSSPECASSNRWRALGVEIRKETYADTQHVHASFEDATIIFATMSVRGPLNARELDLAYSVGLTRGVSQRKFAIEKARWLGSALFDAANDIPGLTQFVLSTLPVLQIDNTAYATPIAAAEHLVQMRHVDYIQTFLPQLWRKTILIKPSPRMEDYHSTLKLDTDGTLSWGTPAPAHTSLNWLNMTDDFGPLVRSLTMSLPFASFSFAAMSDHITGQDICALIAKISGRRCVYRQYDLEDIAGTDQDFLSHTLPRPIGVTLYDRTIFTPASLKQHFRLSDTSIQQTSFEQFLKEVLPKQLDDLLGKEFNEPIARTGSGPSMADTHMEVILGECQKSVDKMMRGTTDQGVTQDRHSLGAAGLRDGMSKGPFLGAIEEHTLAECSGLFQPEVKDFRRLRRELGPGP